MNAKSIVSGLKNCKTLIEECQDSLTTLTKRFEEDEKLKEKL